AFSFTPDDNGSYRIVLTVTDSDGAVGTAEQTVSVGNVAPSPSITSVSSTHLEGTPITATGSATDPAGASDPLTFAWHVSKDGAATPSDRGSGRGCSFTPDDDGSYRVVLTVSDEDGGVGTTEQTVSVANVAPSPSITSISSPRQEG